MSKSKIDAVIEAVRYTPAGQIDMARLYERRGAVWSDRLLIKRSELVGRLTKGKRILTGQRKIHMGGMFETGSQVKLAGQAILTEGKSGTEDHLAGVPLF